MISLSIDFPFSCILYSKISAVNTFSHATNDCNIFRRKIQSAINEGRLAMHEVKDDKASFHVHTIDLDKAKVLIRPEQAEEQKGKILSLVRQGRKISMTRFRLGK